MKKIILIFIICSFISYSQTGKIDIHLYDGNVRSVLLNEFLKFTFLVDEDLCQIYIHEQNLTDSIPIEDIREITLTPCKQSDKIIIYNDDKIDSLPVADIEVIKFIPADTSTGVFDIHTLETVSAIISKIENYPNPSEGLTKIKYELRDEGLVEISLYDIQGTLVSNLESKNKPIGEYITIWDGYNYKGEKVPPGSYFYSVKLVN